MNLNRRALAIGGLRLCTRREVQACFMAAACLAMYFGAVRPERQRLDMALRHAAAAKPAPGTPEPVRFHVRFASQDTFPDALGKILKTAASHALGVNEGDYTVTREATGKLVRFQIVLPLRGDYPQVRSFLAALAHEVPGIALENVRFERRSLADPTLEVKLRLVLVLAAAETGRRQGAAATEQAATGNVFAATSWRAAPAPPPAPPPETAAPAPPSAPPLPFRFLGRYGDGDSHIVMLVKGEQIYLVAAGDTIDDAYRVDQVSGTTVELTYLPLQIKQSLSTGDAG